MEADSSILYLSDHKDMTQEAVHSHGMDQNNGPCNPAVGRSGLEKVPFDNHHNHDVAGNRAAECLAYGTPLPWVAQDIRSGHRGDVRSLLDLYQYDQSIMGRPHSGVASLWYVSGMKQYDVTKHTGCDSDIRCCMVSSTETQMNVTHRAQ